MKKSVSHPLPRMLTLFCSFLRVKFCNRSAVRAAAEFHQCSGLVLAAAGSAAGHLSFLLLDHFLYHISAYRTILLGGQVSVVTVSERYSQLICNFEFESVQCAFCLRNCRSIG